MSHPDISLRALEPEDLDLLYQVENDRSLWNYGPTNVPYSRYLLHEYIATSKADIHADGQVRLVVQNGVGETVGLADITNYDAKNCRAEVGIVVLSDYRRRHFALETLRQLADYARSVLHLHQLYAVIGSSNLPSQMLFKKAGYETVTVLDDWLYDGTDYHSAVLMQLFL